MYTQQQQQHKQHQQHKETLSSPLGHSLTYLLHAFYENGNTDVDYDNDHDDDDVVAAVAGAIEESSCSPLLLLLRFR